MPAVNYAILQSMQNWQPTPPPHKKFKKQDFTQLTQTSQFIYQLDESPILRQPSKIVLRKDITSKVFKAKINYLKNCLLKYRKITGMGRGIAAIQIGIPEALSITYAPDQLLTIINPKITKRSRSLLKYPEMYMSTTPIIAPVIRPSWIEFEYFDEMGELQFWSTKDNTPANKMLNRVFQHEIDHLNGIINIDRLKSPKDLILHSDPQFYNLATFEEIKE